MHRRSHDSRVPPSRTGSACEKHAHGLRPHARRGKRLKSGARSHLTITTRETDGPGFDRVTSLMTSGEILEVEDEIESILDEVNEKLNTLTIHTGSHLIKLSVD